MHFDRVFLLGIRAKVGGIVFAATTVSERFGNCGAHLQEIAQLLPIYRHRVRVKIGVFNRRGSICNLFHANRIAFLP